MAEQEDILRLMTDGTLGVDDVRRRLTAHGELVGGDGSPLRFVPDDPTFPTTVFQGDSLVELSLKTASDLRLEKYLKDLSSWLGVALQPVRRR
jgi:hypothetical protein